MEEYSEFTVNSQVPIFPDDILFKHQCNAECVKLADEHILSLNNRQFLKNNFQLIFGEGKGNQEKMNQIARTEIEIDKLKVWTNLSIERIIRKSFTDTCQSCAHKIVILPTNSLEFGHERSIGEYILSNIPNS